MDTATETNETPALEVRDANGNALLQVKGAPPSLAKPTTHPGDAMNAVLRDLLDNAPEENKGALDLQVTLRNGQAFQGAMRKWKVDGVYVITTPSQQRNEAGRPVGDITMIDIYLLGFDVLHVDVILGKPLDLSIPPGMANLPGLRGPRG